MGLYFTVAMKENNVHFLLDYQKIIIWYYLSNKQGNMN
jgi:hypothetical protein